MHSPVTFSASRTFAWLGAPTTAAVPGTARYSCTLQVHFSHSPVRLRRPLHSSTGAPRCVHHCQKDQEPQTQDRRWPRGVARPARDKPSTPAPRVRAKLVSYGVPTRQAAPTPCTQSAHRAHRLHQKIYLLASEPKTPLAIPPALSTSPGIGSQPAGAAVGTAIHSSRSEFGFF